MNIAKESVKFYALEADLKKKDVDDTVIIGIWKRFQSDNKKTLKLYIRKPLNYLTSIMDIQHGAS